MEIPSTTRFDFKYKEAIEYIIKNPGSKIYLEQGIYPYIVTPGTPPELESNPEYHKSIWPISYGRLHALGLLIENAEIDPMGNGKKTRKYWILDRTKGFGLIKEKRGRLASTLQSGTLINDLKLLLEDIDAEGRVSSQTTLKIMNALARIEEWEKLPK